jgi:uncharacterized membrane protein (UPF0127 family)
MLLNINNHTFKVKTVFTPKDTQNGMMGKKFDSSFNGMLFLMDEGDHCFWMKDCLIDLDIIFINDNEITEIHYNCPHCDSEVCPNFCVYGDTILELRGGTCKRFDIRKGDKILF